MFGAYQSLKFLFIAPLLIVFLFFVNLMTSPGDWWVQWAPWASGSPGSSTCSG